MSEYLYYKVDGRRAKVRADKQSEFESKYPDAKIYYNYQGRDAAVPISGVEEFKQKYGADNVSYSVFDDFGTSASNAESNVPSIREERQARREERQNDGKTTFGETLGKSAAAAGVRTGKLALDLARAAWNTGVVGGAINFMTGKKFDEKLQDEDNRITQWSTKLGETADRLSREADPTGGEKGYVDLIKEGNIGQVAQKALASGIESLPMMLAAGSGWGMLLYGAGMAAGEYSDETRENPDIPSWKRAINSMGSAALEMAVEKIGGPLNDLGKAGKEITEDMAKEILETAVKEGSENIAKRIVKKLGTMVKQGAEEGVEEVVTSFGNDVLGTSLDLIDGDADYGIQAQWNQLKEQNPDASLTDFAKEKGKEYMDAFIGGAVSGLEISTTTEGLGAGVNALRNNESRNIMQHAREVGSSMSYDDLYDTDSDVANAKTAVANSFADKDGNPTISNEFINSLSAEEAYALTGREDFSYQQRRAFGELAIAKAKSDALNGRLDTMRDERVATIRSRMEKASENGQIVTGMVDGRVVYVRGGNVNNREVSVDKHGGHGPLLVIDSVTGEEKVVNSKDITSASVLNAEETINGMVNFILNNEASDRQTARTTMSKRAKIAAVNEFIGKRMMINSENGIIEVEVTASPQSGKVLIKGKKGDLGGQAIKPMDADVFYDSIYRNENGEPIFVEKGEGETEEVEVPETPTAPETPEAPVAAGVAEEDDFRDFTGTILVDGAPLNVSVISQDGPSDTIVYEYEDENGNTRRASATIGAFKAAVQQGAEYAPEAPVVPETPVAETPVAEEVPPTEETPTEEEAPVGEVELGPNDIDWDALFDSDPEAYFVELQKQFGDGAIDMLTAVVEATQEELDGLNKNKGKTQKEIFANVTKKKALQNKIDILNGMIERLTAAPAPETAPEVVPEPVDEPMPEPAPDTETVTETPPTAPAEEPAPEVETPPTDPDEEDGTGPIDPKAKEIVLDNGYIIKDGYVINPTPIEMPNSPKDFSRIFIAEKDGKWGYETYVKFDNMTSYGSPKGAIQVSASHQWFDTKEEAIKAALHYFDFLVRDHGSYKGKPHGNTGIDAFIQYVKDTYLGNDPTGTEKPEGGETAPEAPTEPKTETKPKVKIPKFNAKDILLKGTGPSKGHAYTGIHYEDGYAVTTNGFVIVAKKEAYPAENEGKVITPKGEELSVKFPKWKMLLKDFVNKDISFDIQDMYEFVMSIKDKYGKQWGEVTVEIEDKNGRLHFFPAKYLLPFLKAANEFGGEMSTRGNFGIALMISSDKGTAMVQSKPQANTNNERYNAPVPHTNEPSPQPVAPTAPTVPTAPIVVDNPIEVAKMKDANLLKQIMRIDIPTAQKRDLAYSTGKQVADLFATREEYDAYAENAQNFGVYNEDYERGVDASFANRPQNPDDTPGKSVPLENEPKGGENGGEKDAPKGDGTVRPADGGTGGGATNGGSQAGDKGNPKAIPSQGKGGSEGGKESGKVKHQYPARKGNVTGKILIDTFGLAAVDIPNSRKEILNTFYDFMMEMAKILGISPKSIGNGGWLTLGNLRANARAFARHTVLYKTFGGDIVEQHLLLKYSRVSSIAHEWWHALDHALSFFEKGKNKGPTTEIATGAFDGRQETLEAVRAIMQAIRDSGYTSRIQSHPLYTRDFKKYVLEPTESAARAFAEYMRNKFAENGIAIAGVNEFYDDTQPTAEEMKLITPAIENLFKVLQEKEGKKPGTSILYHIGEMMYEQSDAKKLATESVLDVLKESGIDVEKVTDEQVAQMLAKRDNLSNIEFYQTPNGTVYGWTDGKKIYLTNAGINPNTPVHEYTHLWAKAMMQKNPKGWQSIKDLLRGTPVWNEVLNDPNYSSIHSNEDLVASEVLSRISGTQNAAKLEQMAQQMIDEAKGTARKLEARGLIQNIKDALNKFWNWVGTELFGIEKFESVEQITDRVLWDLMNKTDLGELSEGQVETQIVTDPKVIAELEASPKRTGYRNVVMNEDGTFSSPMAYWLQSTKGGAKTRVETAKFELGKWEEAEEHPELVDENGHVTLVKPNKSTVEVAYDPYIHNRLDPVNLQFKDAWKREELVYVETVVPETDLESGYHAEGALLPVGVHSWSNGDLILSKYDKPVRIMPWDAVADAWVERLNGEGVHFDVVPPALRPLLAERGVEILPPHKGMGKDCFDAYDMWKENPDIRYRFVGEQGAMRIDAATKSTWMLDGLEQARRMEGKFNAKEIKRATGWERGTDGKWRYEEPDNLSIKEDKAKELYDVFVHNREIELGVRPKSEGYKIDVFRLEDVLDAPELYRAYPEFKDMRIRPKMLGGANGIYRGNIIDIHGALFKPSYKGELEDVLLHELQHAIQVKEGFIEGTDASNGWDNYINNAGEVEARNVVARKNMSYAERKLRLASETEDVAREDQIIITNGLLSTDPAYLKSDTQNAAVDYLAGEPRLRAIENAVNEEASKLGVKVTYKTREQMPNGHQNDKGYYDPKTGEVVVCTENATSIADAIQTILHEAVAHKGLRQLMGDKFNEFINRVYESLDAETKAKVDALAEEHYNGNKAVAMEEYMATLAETTDFADNSVWGKIKSIFEDIINAILGRNDIKIGDNELRYILRASYNNMVNPRNMETVRGWAQDQMMREEYKINEATPDILSRTSIDPDEVARETAKSVYERIVNENWQEFQRQFQDAMQPVRIAIDAIQQETGNLPIEDYENFLLMFNQASSRSRVEIDEFSRRYYSPIIEQVNRMIDMIMEKRGWNVKDQNRRAEVYAEVRQYLIAKHGLERNKYYQETKVRLLNAAEKKVAREEALDDYNTELARIASLYKGKERKKMEEIAKTQYEGVLVEIETTRTTPDLRDYAGLTALFGYDPTEWEDAEAEAQRFVDEFERGLGRVDRTNENGDILGYEQSIEIIRLWEKINKATDKTLRHSYESGLISRSQYEFIKSMFGCYIPLRGFDETTAEDVYSYARFEGNRFNPAVHKVKGRTSVADDPLAIIMNMAESEIAQGNKNRAKQALYNFLLNRPVTGMDGSQIQNSLMQVEDVWYIRTFDENGDEVYTIATPDHESGETYEEFEERMRALEGSENSEEFEDGEEVKPRTVTAFKSKKGKLNVGMRFQKPANMNAHYVFLKVNGVEKAIYINGDPKAAQAINGEHKKKRNELVEKMGALNRFISSMFTNYSLEFTARNYFRDMFYSHINIDVKESDPAYRKKFRQNWRHNNLRSMVNMLKAYRAGEYEGRDLNEDEMAFVEFMRNGGQTGYTLINSVETHKKDLERAIANMQKGIEKGGVKDSTIFKFTLGSIELLNEASELVTRFAAFKTSRDMGRGINTSIADAKEVTVNFNTKGAQDGKGVLGWFANYFGWSKYFFNASVQGVQNLKSMAEANKLKFGSVIGGMIATGFLMPVITSAIASLFGNDDEEYWNIPEYERQNNFCVPIGNGKYVKVPLPIGFREVYAIGDMVAAAAFNKKFTRDLSQVGTDIANKLASIILPINPLESTANGLGFWHMFGYTTLPSFAQVAIQNMTNTDWKGAPLQKEYTYNEDDPQWMKAFASNPDWMKGLSKWCNEHINLDGDYKGMDWSPERLDNTLSNVFGGIYSLVKKTGKSISMIWNEENRNLSNIPLSGVVLGSGIDNDDRFVTDAYYDMKEYYDSNVNYINRMAKRFGYTLEDVFEKEKGKHHPKMNEIYSNENFDFMQEWYTGVKELDAINDKIKKLDKKIAAKENPTEQDMLKWSRLNDKYMTERRDFVNDMLELD